MCSFVAANWIISNLTYVNLFLRPRGPDATTRMHLNGFDFVHNLLHMTGERRVQPFVSSNVAALFNGEIYNWRSLLGRHSTHGVSDGDVILPVYHDFGSRFPSIFDGEFAVAVFDFRHNEVLLATDVFGTKPLWYGVDRTSVPQRFAVSSYRSALLHLGLPLACVRMVDPNTVLRLSMDDGRRFGRVVGRRAVFEFDLRQHKASTDDFVSAFQAAVEKRTSGLHPAYVGLSSGYDSGAIHLALHARGKKHYAFAVYGEESTAILGQRIHFASATSETAIIIFSNADFEVERRWLAERVEPFEYLASNITGQPSVAGDQASVGLSYIMRLSRDRGALAYISGSGADEVLSDYGFRGERLCPQSSFGGLFPEPLRGIFPWPEFFLSTQRDYLMKEELVAGVHGMEGRYPFLDARVVQEYLWLAAELKNREYKAPLYDFFSAHGYSFDRGKKQGFAAAANHFADIIRPSVQDAGDTYQDGQSTVIMRYNRHREPRCGAPPATSGVESLCHILPNDSADGGGGEPAELDCRVDCMDGFVAVQDTLRCSLAGRWVGELACLDARLSPSPALLRELQAHAPTIWGRGAPSFPRVVDEQLAAM